MTGFDRLGLHPQLLASLKKMNFSEPTPIQAKAIPPALMGKDVLGSAQTGTGKTAAFGIPLVQYLLLNGGRGAMVLTPTRELAQQVCEVMKNLTTASGGISACLLIGGMDMKAQAKELRNRPRVIVGTPGRIIDHLEQGTLFLGHTEFLVLDETDRMLDMGFGIQLDKIRKFLKPRRQTLMFSATLPPNIMQLAGQYLTEPVRINVGGNAQPIDKIKQSAIRTTQREKFGVLRDEVKRREGTIIIFVRTKSGADVIAEKLRGAKLAAKAIHGDLSQAQREMVIDAFRKEEFRILVATDIAARGLDIHHISHVINYELPTSPEDYIHRIGRTGRAGAEGEALVLLTEDDAEQWRLINRMIDSGSARPEPLPVDAPAPAEPNKSHSHRKFKEPKKRHYDGEKMQEESKERKRRRRGGRGRGRGGKEGGAQGAGASSKAMPE